VMDPPEKKNRAWNAILNDVTTIEPKHIAYVCIHVSCHSCFLDGNSLTPPRLTLGLLQERLGMKRTEISATAKCTEPLSGSSNTLRMWSGRRIC